MNTHILELAHTDLDDVSGGLRNFPIQPVPTAPVSPPIIIPIIPIPVPPTHDPFSAPSGILER